MGISFFHLVTLPPEKLSSYSEKMYQLKRNEEELEVLIGRARDLHNRLSTQLIITKQLKETDGGCSTIATTIMFERRSCCHLVHGNCCCRLSSYSDRNKYYNSSLMAGETEAEEVRKGLVAIRDSMRDVGNCLSSLQTRLQAQAAGLPYQVQGNSSSSKANMRLPVAKSPQMHNPTVPSGEQGHYKGTLDVFYKVIRQEGFSRLWRGTNASLALAVPTVGIYLPCYDIFRNHMEEFTIKNAPNVTPYVPLVAGSVARSLACVSCYPVELARTRMQAFTHSQGVKPPGVLKTLLGVVSPIKTVNDCQNVQNYRVLWTGLGAQLARDVPFSAICWVVLEPIRRRILNRVGEEASAVTILGANFCAGFLAGSLAAGSTCPLDVARTRRQIEKDPTRQMRMTTKQTLAEIWRDGGWKGLFTGVGPRVARAGPSVGIVVSFYEVVKYGLHQRRLSQVQ